MKTKLSEWVSEHGQITKIGLSEGCGGKTLTMAVEFGYGWGGFDGYLGNVGLANIASQGHLN